MEKTFKVTGKDCFNKKGTEIVYGLNEVNAIENAKKFKIMSTSGMLVCKNYKAEKL
jgi:hypothetical protein